MCVFNLLCWCGWLARPYLRQGLRLQVLWLLDAENWLVLVTEPGQCSCTLAATTYVLHVMKIQAWKRTVLHVYDMNKVSMTTMFPPGQLVLRTANCSRSEHYVAAMQEDKITPNSTTTVAFWTIVFWTCHNLRAPTQSTHYLHGLFAPPPVMKSGWWRFWSTAILKYNFFSLKSPYNNFSMPVKNVYALSFRARVEATDWKDKEQCQFFQEIVGWHETGTCL